MLDNTKNLFPVYILRQNIWFFSYSSYNIPIYFSPMKYIFLLPFLLFPTLTFGNTYIQKKIDGHTIRVVKFPLDSQLYDIKIIKTYTPTTL